MDRGDWWTPVLRVAKSQAGLKPLSAQIRLDQHLPKVRSQTAPFTRPDVPVHLEGHRLYQGGTCLDPGLGQFSAKQKFCKEAFMQGRQVLILQAKVSPTSPFPRDKDASLSGEGLRGLAYPGIVSPCVCLAGQEGPEVYSDATTVSELASLLVATRPGSLSGVEGLNWLPFFLLDWRLLSRMSEVVIYAGVRKIFFKKRHDFSPIPVYFLNASANSTLFGNLHVRRKT